MFKDDFVLYASGRVSNIKKILDSYGNVLGNIMS